MKLNQIASFLLLTIVTGLLYAGWFGQGGLKQIRNNLQEYDSLTKQINNVQQQNTALQSEIKNFTEDKFFL